jgi:hypothetical protein
MPLKPLPAHSRLFPRMYPHLFWRGREFLVASESRARGATAFPIGTVVCWHGEYDIDQGVFWAGDRYDHLPYAHVTFAREETPPEQPINVVRTKDGRVRFYKSNWNHVEARMRALLSSRRQYPLTEEEAKEIFALFNLKPMWVQPKQQGKRHPVGKMPLPLPVVMPSPPGQEPPLTYKTLL